MIETLPQCRECGQPSPKGDPCEECVEINRILAITDEEALASSTPEEIAWANGMKEGMRLGKMIWSKHAADENERLQAKLGFWMRNSERKREQARINHDCYLRLWAEHGGPELPERLREGTRDE